MQTVFKKKFWCTNPVKLAEAIKAANGSEDLVLAEYDKRAGLIKDWNTGEKIERGTFYDFEKGEPRKAPKKTSKKAKAKRKK